MGLLSSIFRKNDYARRDAKVVYNALLKQARRPEFFGKGRFPDSYDGRIDVLTLHMSIMLQALRNHGEQGQRLSQALFDEMKDDFEIALREEGLSDTGVSKRIKPMIRLFYTRAKDYTNAFADKKAGGVAAQLYTESEAPFETNFGLALNDYAASSLSVLSKKALGELAQAKFEFPKLN